MRTGAARPIIVGLALVVLAAAHPGALAEPPEPPGYRTQDYKAPTPATVVGGTVLDTLAAERLWRAGGAVWVDVLTAPRRPANLPPAAEWMPLPHRDIPGSLWLPDVGRGELNSKLESYFRNSLAQATRQRKDLPIVFYCLANCWMSWNAAKRAASWGYTRVYWYRDGTDGWEAAKLPVAAIQPVPGP